MATMGILKQSQKRTKRAPFSEASMSSALGLVGDEADRAPCHASEAYDDVLGKVGGNLEEVLMVADGLDDVFDVVRDIGVRGDDAFELVA